MIKTIKIGNLIYQNIEPYYIDENGNKIWNIPNDVNQLKFCLSDTLGWLVAQKIQKTLGSIDKKDVSTSKAITLLAKLISTLSPDTSVLTENEQNAYDTILNLANNGYSDSELLVNALNAIQTYLTWYQTKITELESIDLTSETVLDDLIKFAENID